MAEITIFNIFDAIIQFVPYSIACLNYILLVIFDVIFSILDNIIWHPASLLWNAVVDFMNFMQTFFELTFSWGEGIVLLPVFLVCLTFFSIRILIGIWYQIKKLIPVIG